MAAVVTRCGRARLFASRARARAGAVQAIGVADPCTARHAPSAFLGFRVYTDPLVYQHVYTVHGVEHGSVFTRRYTARVLHGLVLLQATPTGKHEARVAAVDTNV